MPFGAVVLPPLAYSRTCVQAHVSGSAFFENHWIAYPSLVLTLNRVTCARMGDRDSPVKLRFYVV